jgi:hypothetical protein
MLFLRHQRPIFEEHLLNLKIEQTVLNENFYYEKNCRISWEKPHKKQNSKIVISNKVKEEVSCFSCLGFNVSYCLKENMNIKLSEFRRMYGRIRRTQRQKELIKRPTKIL